MASYLGWEIDFSGPAGEPAYFEPCSPAWRIYKNPVALAVGGVAAVLLEFAEPRVRSGVWDHSVYKEDPIGRSRRTATAAMVGVYGPRSAARRIIQGVTNMHANVRGLTPAGEPYHALEPALLDWVSATAHYGFLAAYDRFVTRISDWDKARFWREAAPLARLYGVQHSPGSTPEFLAMMQALSPRFEPHPIVGEFLSIIRSPKAMPGAPGFLRRAVACGAVSLLPPLVRERLELPSDLELTAGDTLALKAAAAFTERRFEARSPWAQACLRLGLPADFLYRRPADQRRLIERTQQLASLGASA